MKPLTTINDDGREFVAVGFVPQNGHVVWVPADTEIVVSPIVEDDEPEIDHGPDEFAEADPTMPTNVSGLILPS